LFGKVDAKEVSHVSRASQPCYSPVRKVGGWMKSSVYGKSFRLVATKNQLGQPDLN
jgi:hypothetical protein